MIVAYKNFANEAIEIIPSTEDSIFVASEIIHPHLSRVWKATSNESWLIFDLGEEKEVDALILGNTSLTDSASITIEGNTVNDFTSPPFTSTFTGEDYHLFNNATYRWFKISFSDPTGPATRIGNIFLGQKSSMPAVSSEWSSEYISQSVRTIGLSGQVFGNIGYKSKSFSFEFPVLTNEEKNTLIDLFEINDKVTPFWCIVWENSTDIQPPVYVVINQDSLSFNKLDTSGLFYSLSSLDLLEVF